MNPFEGKSPEERNKTIVAIVLGVLALGALSWGIILPMFSGSKKTTRVNVNESSSKDKVTTDVPDKKTPVAPLPAQQVIDSAYMVLPVVYSSGGFSAAAPGRNIFAFYEPPKPTPYSPTPTPLPKPSIYEPPPTPVPPPIFLAYATPQSVYAGSKGFLLEVNGDMIPEDAVILFNGSQLPTNFITAQGLTAQVSDNMIASPGQKQITVITPDGSKYSNMLVLNVQEPPKPDFQYIGMIARKRNNNDTAYFEEKGNKNKPISARLDDVVGGRFRLKSISTEEVVFEDVNLGFRHKLALYRPEPGSGSDSSNPGKYNPNNRTRPTPIPRVNTTTQPQRIPGIPDNIPRYKPTPRPNQKDDDPNDEKKPG